MRKTFFQGFKDGFKAFGHKINSIINFILLFIVYFLAVGPTSLIAKAMKKKFLPIKEDKNSYWISHKPIKEIEDYYRQF